MKLPRIVHESKVIAQRTFVVFGQLSSGGLSRELSRRKRTGLVPQNDLVPAWWDPSLHRHRRSSRLLALRPRFRFRRPSKLPVPLVSTKTSPIAPPTLASLWMMQTRMWKIVLISKTLAPRHHSLGAPQLPPPPSQIVSKSWGKRGRVRSRANRRQGYEVTKKVYT